MILIRKKETLAIIALAESLPQNKSLIRLDLSDNHAIEMAGFMALAASLQMNHTMTYIDIHTPVRLLFADMSLC